VMRVFRLIRLTRATKLGAASEHLAPVALILTLVWLIYLMESPAYFASHRLLRRMLRDEEAV